MDFSWFERFSISHLPGFVSRRNVTLAIMAVILFQGTGIFYTLMQLQLIRMKPLPVAQKKIQAAAAAVRETADGYRIIAERNLFGTTNKAVAEKPELPVQRDISQLLDLNGTMAGDTQTGYAIIEEKATQKQRLVKAGDLIAGAKVIRIHRKAVDLLVDEQEQTLRIIEAPLRSAPLIPSSPGALSSLAAPMASASSIPDLMNPVIPHNPYLPQGNSGEPYPSSP